ncbi:MAG: replicative DNA helicase, partial [Pseudonocardiales bacterium]
MLLSPAAIADVVEVLARKDFYRPAHAVIFDAVLRLFGKGEPSDAVTVADELGAMGELPRVGGAVYLHTLISTVPTAANAGYYAQIVAEKATLRNLVMAGDRISQLGYGADARGEAGSGSVAEVVDRAQAELYSVGEDRHRADVVEVGELLQSTLDQVEAIGSTGGVVEGLVATGLADLDDRLAGGLLPGQLAVMAGRPGSGKSSLALGMAAHAALHANTPAVVFSLEMGRLELMLRLLSAAGSIPLRSLRTGQVSDQHWARLAHCSQQLAGAPLHLDDSPNLTVTEIRAKARRLKQRGGLGLVVVDYLQLMSSGGRVESRQVEVAGFSRAMKLLAMELEVPVIALSQLNRGPEQRTDK